MATKKASVVTVQIAVIHDEKVNVETEVKKHIEKMWGFGVDQAVVQRIDSATGEYNPIDALFGQFFNWLTEK